MANEALLLLLILGWAAVLLPSAIRSRRRSTLASVGGFERAMDVLKSRPDGRQIMVPRDADRANQIVVGRERPQHPERPPVGEAGRRLISRQSALVARRRAVFLRLLGANAVGLLLAVVVGGVFWTLSLLGLGVLAGYATLLRHYKIERDQARQVVRTIDIRTLDERPETEERELVAVGAEPPARGWQVASRHDEPWEPQSGVRIRRWD